MKVLVTGGAGFIGSNIVDLLLSQGYEVVIVDDLSTGKKEYINSKASFYLTSLNNKDLEKVFLNENPDYVIHHAAQISVTKSINDPIADANSNIIGTINLLECCKKYNVKKIIYASSAAVYGDPDYLPIDENHKLNPISFYGISKHTPEHYIELYSKLYNLNFTILRYSNVYGIRQDPKGEGGVISIFIDRILNNEELIVFGDGHQTRDYIYVKDIAKANLLSIERGNNEIINISTGKETSINELIKILSDLVGKKLNVVYKEHRKGDILYNYLNNNKAANILGWKPFYRLEQGLYETIDYYIKKKNNKFDCVK